MLPRESTTKRVLMATVAYGGPSGTPRHVDVGTTPTEQAAAQSILQGTTCLDFASGVQNEAAMSEAATA